MRSLLLIRGENKKDVPLGEELSFEVLLSQVLERLWSFAYKLTSQQIQAEDLFQEGVLKAFQAFGVLQDKGKFRSWIFQILHRTWISTYRKKAHFLDIPLNEDLFINNNSWDLFPWDENGEKFGEEVEVQLNSLVPEFREVIWLKYVEDFNYQEIAKILNVSEGTVASRLFRAKELLKEKLMTHAKEKGW